MSVKKNILLIDDDEEMCDELIEVLIDAGYNIDCVHNGTEGKNLILQRGYDLILLDIKLPGLTGYEVLKATEGRTKEAKILILTGRPMQKDAEPGAQLTEEDREEENALKLANGIINKPFDLEKILATIKQITL
ncbi:MAG: hypothetical protein A2251_00465 [Elusimicrobia bacterium RIFOXYA2_FULL_47_53]|nr:MAG: hypothetical protein A2251_00465 [Elusimicrobia bacterium RIFOXYA2_FULL_47_53]